jgi:hypothetical protein
MCVKLRSSVITINVLVVYCIWRVCNGAEEDKIQYEGHWKGWALKIETFLGFEMATSVASAIWAQKSLWYRRGLQNSNLVGSRISFSAAEFFRRTSQEVLPRVGNTADHIIQYQYLQLSSQMTQYIYYSRHIRPNQAHTLRRELDCPLKWVGRYTSSVLPPTLANLSSKEYEHVNYPPWCMESTEPAKMFFFLLFSFIYFLTLI